VTAEHLALLRSVPMFAELSDDALARVASVAAEVDVESGHVLIQPQQEGAGLFVLLEGRATVEVSGRTFDCGPGEFLGELSVLADDLVHTARVRASSPLRCLAIRRDDFRALLHDEPRLAVGMLPSLARRLARTDAMLARG
jgi:CRP-like cAMP-binding protein